MGLDADSRFLRLLLEFAIAVKFSKLNNRV
jgi:hypothetical protein